MLKKQQKGLSLIELLIGLLVGAIVTAGAISLFTGSLRSSTDNQNLTRINQDLRAMMDIMTRDIRRAGYATSDLATPDPADLVPPFDLLSLPSLLNNPFFNTVNAGATTGLAVYNGGACIVYAYNRDSDSPAVVDSNERLGFRLSNTGELEMRQTGTTNENCTNGTWENITEPEVEITTLRFALEEKELNVTSMMIDTDSDGCYDGDDQDPATASAGCVTGNYGNGSCDSGEACNTCIRDGSPPDPACLYVRTVTITLAGRLRSDNTVTQSITEQVRVRNDKYVAAVP